MQYNKMNYLIFVVLSFLFSFFLPDYQIQYLVISMVIWKTINYRSYWCYCVWIRNKFSKSNLNLEQRYKKLYA